MSLQFLPALVSFLMSFTAQDILQAMTSADIFYSVYKVAGCWFNFSKFVAQLQTVALLAHPIKHAVGPIRDIDRDLCPAQLGEGLGIQNEQESTFLLSGCDDD